MPAASMGEAFVVVVMAGQGEVDAAFDSGRPQGIDLFLGTVFDRGRPSGMVHRDRGAGGGVRRQVAGQPRGLLRAVDLVAVRIQEIEPPGSDLPDVVRAGLEVAEVAVGAVGLVLVIARDRGDDVVEPSPPGCSVALELLEFSRLVLQIAERDHGVRVQ